MPHVLALDQGTTSSRAIVFDPQGRVVASAQREFTQHFPRPGWVEHDPLDLWTTQRDTARLAVEQAGVDPADLAGVGITNQRETTLVWHRQTGRPVYPAIVWQDRRTADACERLKGDGVDQLVQQRAGLVLDPYFSATKIAWVLGHVEDARAQAERGELCFGTVDTWLVWQLTGGAVYATDVTNASRTMLMNLQAGAWDEELCAAFGVPRTMLPEIVPSSGVVGEIDADVLGTPLPLAALCGDQQSALIGQACTRPGMAKNTYGTGCFMLLHTGDAPQPSEHRLLTTAAAQLPGQARFALEGSVFIGGAVVQWLRDGLGIIDDSSRVEALASSVPDSGGVFLVPAFAGLGAPHWDPYARGTITGLTRGTTRAHLARAALDAIAYQVADVMDVMAADAGAPLTELRVDGGASRNDLLMQFQADLLGVPVVRPEVTETTAAGAAYLAGLATGVWPDEDAVAACWKAERTFEPTMPASEADRCRSRWAAALERAGGWAQSDAEAGNA